MLNHRPLSLALLAACAVSACGSPKANTDAPEASPDPAISTVVREDVTATPAPTPAPVQQAVIQTQPGPKGSQVALNKIAVTGDIMTVQLTYDGGAEWQSPSLKDVNVIDDATSQRISVLKDGEGNYMASPINSGVRSSLGFALGKGPQIVWFKFPAPPATSKTISLNVPDVVPFDGVPVTR